MKPTLFIFVFSLGFASLALAESSAEMVRDRLRSSPPARAEVVGALVSLLNSLSQLETSIKKECAQADVPFVTQPDQDDLSNDWDFERQMRQVLDAVAESKDCSSVAGRLAEMKFTESSISTTGEAAAALGAILESFNCLEFKEQLLEQAKLLNEQIDSIDPSDPNIEDRRSALIRLKRRLELPCLLPLMEEQRDRIRNAYVASGALSEQAQSEPRPAPGTSTR